MRLSVWMLPAVLFITGIPAAASYAQVSVTTQTPVDIVFDDAGDFQNGVLGINKTITIGAGLNLISNRTLTVVASSNLSNGTVQIPVNIVRLSSVGSGWTNYSIFMNTSSQQVVTSGITVPSFSTRNYNLRYEIPSAASLFNQPNGIYSTTLSYRLSGLLPSPVIVTLNLRIQNVLGIASNYNPVFTINEVAEYQNGISITQTGALTVTSTLNYDVHVRASGPFASGSRTIPASHLSIAVLNAGGSITGNIPVTTTASQLVNEGTAAISKPLTLRYTLAGGSHLLNLPDNSYSTTLTYTISAD